MMRLNSTLEIILIINWNIVYVICEGIGFCTQGSVVKCCFGFELKHGKCIECQPGWYGENCSLPCPEETYGHLCRKKCKDCFDKCHHQHGCISSNENATKKGNESMSGNGSMSKGHDFFEALSSSPWIASISGTGTLIFLCIFTALWRKCYKSKIKWKTTLRSGITTNDNANTVSGSCCEAKTQSSCKRLPCKNCAMNFNAKIVVNEYPHTHTSSSREKEDQFSQLYSTIGNEYDVHECPSSENDINLIPLEIDEKYIMVTNTSSAIDTSSAGFQLAPGKYGANGVQLAPSEYSANGVQLVPSKYRAYFRLETSEAQYVSPSTSEVFIAENLPPPCFEDLE